MVSASPVPRPQTIEEQERKATRRAYCPWVPLDSRLPLNVPRHHPFFGFGFRVSLNKR